MKLGDRMKKYEFVTRNYLTCRTPVIVRIDGRAFHTFTRGLEKPYDIDFMRLMQNTTLELCKEISGCKLGYTQSDEISLLLTDWDNNETQAWFQNNLSKIISITASLTTLKFNEILEDKMQYTGFYNKFNTKKWKATFDSRAFNIPKEEVCNYFIWRQQDATRNAIQSAGQTYFSHSQLQNKNCNEIKEMLWSKENINFDKYSTDFKRGSCVIKKDGEWNIDLDIPIFTQDRDYIDKWLGVE